MSFKSLLCRHLCQNSAIVFVQITTSLPIYKKKTNLNTAIILKVFQNRVKVSQCMMTSYFKTIRYDHNSVVRRLTVRVDWDGSCRHLSYCSSDRRFFWNYKKSTAISVHRCTRTLTRNLFRLQRIIELLCNYCANALFLISNFEHCQTKETLLDKRTLN